jgi:hypothetical protein
MAHPRPPAPESAEYETVKDLKEYFGYAKTAIEILIFLYEFGRMTPVDRALNRIRRDLSELADRVKDLEPRLAQLSIRQAETENRARVRLASDHMRALGVLATQLEEAPTDAALASRIAIDAGSRADQMLSDDDAWLWTDIRKLPPLPGSSEPRVELMAPDFKPAIALPAYAMAIAVWGAAIVIEAKNSSGDVRPKYRDQLYRHVDAVTRRTTWQYGEEPVTLMEKILARLYCLPRPQHNYARDGICNFWVDAVDEMQRTTWTVGQFSRDGYDGPNALCQIPSDYVADYEQPVHDADSMVVLLRELEKTLRALAAGARFPASPAVVPHGGFGPVRHRSNVYTITPDGVLRYHEHSTPPDPATAGSWHFGPLVVGYGFDQGLAVPGGGSVIYIVNGGSSVQRYRHRGSEVSPPTADWEDGHGEPIPDPSLALALADVVIVPRDTFGGGDGVLYAVVKPPPEAVARFQYGDLTWRRHSRYAEGGGEFTTERVIGYGWDTFREVFSVGEGVLYGLLQDGGLRWYRHTDYLTGKPTWEGPLPVGGHVDWAAFRAVFGGESGFVYALTNDGQLLCFRHADYLNGGPNWEGPIAMIGNWTDVVRGFAQLPGEAFFEAPH